MAEPIKQVQVGGTNYNIRGYFYGTCDTAIDVSAKVVTCPEFSSTDLVDSTILVINFAEELDTIEAGYITLNVNGTGAKSLKRFVNGDLSDSITLYYTTPALCIYSTVNDCWILIGPCQDANTTYSAPTVDRIQGWTINRYAACSTGASTAAKTASVTNGTVTLNTGLAVCVKFANANTASNPTLNINSKGAKNIFYNGVQITTGSEKGLLKGLCLFVYDGTQWHLIPSSAVSESGNNFYVQNAAGTQSIHIAGTNDVLSFVGGSGVSVSIDETNSRVSVSGSGLATSTHTHSINTTSTNTSAATPTVTVSLSGTTSTSGTFTILTITGSGSQNGHTHTYLSPSSTGTPQ